MPTLFIDSADILVKHDEALFVHLVAHAKRASYRSMKSWKVIGLLKHNRGWFMLQLNSYGGKDALVATMLKTENSVITFFCVEI